MDFCSELFVGTCVEENVLHITKLPQGRVWYPTAYILMKKMSSIYNGWAVLFENLNGMGVPLNHSFQY